MTRWELTSLPSVEVENVKSHLSVKGGRVGRTEAHDIVIARTAVHDIPS